MRGTELATQFRVPSAPWPARVPKPERPDSGRSGCATVRTLAARRAGPSRPASTTARANTAALRVATMIIIMMTGS